jgi:hypothetical protein
MHLLLPATLDLDRHLLLHPPTHLAKFKRDELVQVLHLLTEVPARNRKLARRVRESNGFVPISARWAQQAVRGYNHYLNYAVASGILETDQLCWPSTATRTGKCTGYRFAPVYQERASDAGFPRMQLVAVEDPKMVQKIRRQRQQTCPTPAERLRYHQHRHLLDWLATKSTPYRLDAPAALAAAAREREAQEADPTLRRPKSAGWKRKWAHLQEVEHFVSPTEQYNQRLHTITRLVDGDLNPVLDQVGGRLHSTLTNMSSLLRPFVYAEGHDRLVSLDLANSQPYLLNILLNPAFYRKELPTAAQKHTHTQKHASFRWEREGKEIRKEVQAGYEEDIDLMLVNILQKADQEELARFRDWTSSGLFYQQLRAAIVALGEAEVVATPSAVKELIFLVLFSKNKCSTPGKRAFTKLFPTVDKVLRTIKQADHTALPRLLQRLEAKLLLQTISRRVARVMPAVPLLTVHDSLVVPLSCADQVQQIMMQELTAQVGLPPCIKRELWGQQVAHLCGSLPRSSTYGVKQAHRNARPKIDLLAAA